MLKHTICSTAVKCCVLKPESVSIVNNEFDGQSRIVRMSFRTGDQCCAKVNSDDKSIFAYALGKSPYVVTIPAPNIKDVIARRDSKHGE